MEYELHSLSSVDGDCELGIISLIVDSKMGGVSRDSFSKRAYLSDSLEVPLLWKADGGEDPIEKLMPHMS